MVTIHKPVSRRTRHEYAVLRQHKQRAIVVSLCPGDVIEFRELRGKHRWSLDIETAFRIAVRCSSNMGICFVPIRKKKAVAS